MAPMTAVTVSAVTVTAEMALSQTVLLLNNR